MLNFMGLGKSKTTKADVIMAAAAALIAAWKVTDTYKDYKAEQEQKELAE